MNEILGNKKTKSSEIAIDIKNLNKTFKIHSDRKSTLRQMFSGFFSQGKVEEFHALKDINLQIRKGEFVGIIGRNGSGKSTLLKIIAGIYSADRGSKVKVKGRIVPFLELGVGFNHDLSGRENIYLNGTILGMTRKFLNKKFDEIVGFAELEEFIDEPVKNYSSGMLVRLAFSIAIQADADIYILDEVLAVGDEGFQRKCMSIINNLKVDGKTILYVSHDLGSIERLSDRTIYLKDSIIEFDGKNNIAVEKMRTSTLSEDIKNQQKTEQKVENIPVENGKVRFPIEISKVDVLNSNNKLQKIFIKSEKLKIRLHLHKNNQRFKALVVGVAIATEDGISVSANNTDASKYKVDANADFIDFIINTQQFVDSKYKISTGLFKEGSLEPIGVISERAGFEIRLNTKEQGIFRPDHEWRVGYNKK